MKVELFDFELPEGLVAQRPAPDPLAARLLVAGGTDTADRAIGDLPGLLHPGDICVFNDTRVIPARMQGVRGGVKIEVTLIKQVAPNRWRAFARPGKRLKVGDRVDFSGTLHAGVTLKPGGGEVELEFCLSDGELMAAIEKLGAMPLPPYIKRTGLDDEHDPEDYQTMFAERPGAVAAPTAGLHFTPELIADLEKAGIQHTRLTLHVGAGTFLPVKVDDTDDHQMHVEWGEITPAAADAINAARTNGGRVVAVGTTSLRLLESAAGDDGTVKPFSGETGIFITPGYRFKTVDVMLTNFHLPKSTLFMLVSAFMGLERMQKLYAHAINNKYRFYSYGDACLLTRPR